jgi:hypothetical protein
VSAMECYEECDVSKCPDREFFLVDFSQTQSSDHLITIERYGIFIIQIHKVRRKDEITSS